MEIHYKIIGYVLILLSLIHVVFPRYFNWKKELKTLSLINQEIMKVHTFFIALVVLLIGVLCLVATDDMIYTDLGKKISLGIGLFWNIRLVFQFVGYSTVLWKGKKLETTIHILAIILWTYLSTVFLYVYFK